MDSQPSTSSGTGEKKKKSRMKVFQHYWLRMNIFKDWLMPHENNEKALCTACNKVLTCGKLDLIRHSKTKLHVMNLNKSRNVISPSALLLNNDNDNDNDNKNDNDNENNSNYINKVETVVPRGVGRRDVFGSDGRLGYMRIRLVGTRFHEGGGSEMTTRVDSG